MSILSKGVVKKQSRPFEKTHGMSGTSTHRSWKAMLNRCRNKNGEDWPDYGGRGIKVCRRWHSFFSFLEDMGEKPDGYSIDRIDPNGNYEPSNCRWLPMHLQSVNRRNCPLVTYQGRTLRASEWREILGLKKVTYKMRRIRGWSIEQALFTPIDTKRRRKK